MKATRTGKFCWSVFDGCTFNRFTNHSHHDPKYAAEVYAAERNEGYNHATALSAANRATVYAEVTTKVRTTTKNAK